MGPLQELASHGQSVWIDYIRRDFTRTGQLADLVARGVRGVTSNPSIFEKAIGGSAAYDDALQAMLDVDPARSPTSLFEAVAIVDIQEAADVLRPIYDGSQGADGFVSLEVSPTLAHDAEGTIRDARRLWAAVDRPNLMIKVPATAAGIPAIEELIAGGINVNVTLMFSLQHYEDVARAYIRGLRRAADPTGIASVASFFVSRVDSAVDKALDAVGTDQAARLRGHAAIANSKLAYQRYQEIFEGDEFADLAGRGARAQRVLWASTSAKDPAYSDVMYVEELVGDNTVNTIPPATLDAFVDHGTARPDAVLEDLDAAVAAIAGLSELGIDFDAITSQLQVDGVASFGAAFATMLGTIAEKSRRLLAASVDPQSLELGEYAVTIEATLARWTDESLAARIWDRDYSVWIDEPAPEITDRLGWLTLPRTMRHHLEDIKWFVNGVRADGLTTVVLLGMGGSSLAPDVFRKTFGVAAGYPDLIVLDSTHPAAVLAVAEQIDPMHTLFLVASKSGTTIEPLSFFEFFWAQLATSVAEPGAHFVAITDPGSELAVLGNARGFRRVFETIPDVGGRYSALTHFGLVPAALIGIDVALLLDQALRMEEAAALPALSNPGLRLGAALGELARLGRDKATFVTSPSFNSLPDWMEQLIAESTGKDGVGIVPVAGEQLASPDAYGADRVFIYIGLAADDDGEQVRLLDDLAAAGHPVVRIVVDQLADLASEMYRAEIAVAAAGAVLRIHPFNQPDVQLAKKLAQQAMAGEGSGDAISEIRADDPTALNAAMSELLALVEPDHFFAIQAFLAPTAESTAVLQSARHAVRDRMHVATTLGFGPRFLHSTGQLHKGGANNGVFLQIVHHFTPEVAVPGTDYTFGSLIAAQSDGDYRALTDAGRRVIRVCLGDDVAGGLINLEAALRG